MSVDYVLGALGRKYRSLIKETKIPWMDQLGDAMR